MSPENAMQDRYDAFDRMQREAFEAGVEAAAAIADKWATENRAAANRARGKSDAFDALDGAAIGCNAIAQEIRTLASKGSSHDD